ncbi:MAG: DUF2071 domain-containing protein [Chloroflexi bacterium]|nr:DUF2071 domain-containing protein [Chloroflexota bacterium]
MKYRRDLSRASRQAIFLTTEWRYLAMLNYEINPALLQPFLPKGTELDTWNGKHYISVVGLLFQNTRLYGVPVPFHRDFEEINLRFYVRREVAGEVRRGVVFIKEIVPKPAITLVARAFYNENYVTLPTSHCIYRDKGGLSVSYEWRQSDFAHSLFVRAEGAPAEIQDNTEEEFIAEHYWGYTVQRDGGTLEYEVEHPRWRIWRIDNARLKCDVEKIYGSQFAKYIGANPDSALLAEGSPVIVRRGIRI